MSQNPQPLPAITGAEYSPVEADTLRRAIELGLQDLYNALNQAALRVDADASLAAVRYHFLSSARGVTTYG